MIVTKLDQVKDVPSRVKNDYWVTNGDHCLNYLVEVGRNLADDSTKCGWEVGDDLMRQAPIEPWIL